LRTTRSSNTGSLRRSKPYDAIEEHDVPVIIAGFGRFGQIVARILRVKGLPFTAARQQPGRTWISYGASANKVYYGGRPPGWICCAPAGAEGAQILVLAIDGRRRLDPYRRAGRAKQFPPPQDLRPRA